MAHRPTDAEPTPAASPLVDGTLRTEARLTRTGPDGDVSIGPGGKLGAGGDHRDGWRWEPYAVDGADVEAARQQLQRLMRDAEADIAEALSNDGWLTVFDGPSSAGRPRRPRLWLRLTVLRM